MLSDATLPVRWTDIGSNLWAEGFSLLGQLLTEEECLSLQSAYDNRLLFRSHIEMSRFGFGRGEYKYFAAPLPPLVSKLREYFYPPLAHIAREWMTALSLESEFPAGFQDFLEICREHGQTRPTPLLLHYQAGDFNCLHQDLYGDIFFPFQVIICLSKSMIDFTGGELLLVEQRPRAQSIGRVVHLSQGEGAVITTRFRPAKGARGHYRTVYRHGVSPLLSGERFSLGVLFHDAK
jgi:hypothetical protein